MVLIRRKYNQINHSYHIQSLKIQIILSSCDLLISLLIFGRVYVQYFYSNYSFDFKLLNILPMILVVRSQLMIFTSRKRKTF